MVWKEDCCWMIVHDCFLVQRVKILGVSLVLDGWRVACFEGGAVLLLA